MHPLAAAAATVWRPFICISALDPRVSSEDDRPATWQGALVERIAALATTSHRILPFHRSRIGRNASTVTDRAAPFRNDDLKASRTKARKGVKNDYRGMKGPGRRATTVAFLFNFISFFFGFENFTRSRNKGAFVRFPNCFCALPETVPGLFQV